MNELHPAPGRACPLGDGCAWTLAYPGGYQDPPHDGTEDGFTEVVRARRAALLGEMNAHLDSHGISGVRFA